MHGISSSRAPPKKLGSILADDALAATLREGAAAVARDLVCPTCLTDYIHETLRTLREQFRGDLALDSRDSMRKSLVGVNCTRLGLTELKLDPHHGLSVVAAPLPPSQTSPRPGEDAVCLALLDQAYPLRTAHHLARAHPVRFVMLVVYAAGLLFIFLMKRQD